MLNQLTSVTIPDSVVDISLPGTSKSTCHHKKLPS